MTTESWPTLDSVNTLEKYLHVGVALRLALVEEHPGRVELVGSVDLLVLLLVNGLVLADLAAVGLGFRRLDRTLVVVWWFRELFFLPSWS